MIEAQKAWEAGDFVGAAEAWERHFNTTAQREPTHLVSYARVLAELNRPHEAIGQLNRALAQPLTYNFFPRTEKLIKKLGVRYEGYIRDCRIALLGTSTTALLPPILNALCLRDRINVQVYEGMYGSVSQEVLDPSSGLSRFRPTIVFLNTNWRDLHLPPISENDSNPIGGIVERQKLLWTRLAEQFGCHVVQFAYDYPAEEPYGYLAASLEGGRTRVIEQLNQRLRESAPANVSILDTPALQRETGLARWQDASQWFSFQQHPSTEALPALAEVMLAHCRAVLGLTRKVLITDLDNTLWKGVIGEDGLDGIKLGPGSAAGEAHSRLQQYLLDLKARGILLAVASKNNYDDAALPFQRHPHTLLRMEDFSAFEANWNDKATGLRAIANKLSLGLDSFVFLDDNPIEREWVRAQLPGLAVVELGESVFDYVRELDRSRYFFAISLSAEDRVRSDQYRSEASRKHLQATSQSLDEFLAQLQLRATCEPVTEKNLARVAQLTNKTNQFNLTTRRYTEAQVRQLAESPDCWAAAFHLSDRMGDYGLIGVIFCRPGASPKQWEIDTWLMSCRVLGRQMEKFMFDRLVEAAQLQGLEEIKGVYIPTPKNGLVRDLYATLGFARVNGSDYFTIPSRPVATAIHIQNLLTSK